MTVKVSVLNGGDAVAGPFTVQWWPANGATTPLGCDWAVASMVAHGGLVLDCTYDSTAKRDQKPLLKKQKI